MSDVSAEIDELLRQLAQSDDSETRDEICNRLARLNRQKVTTWPGPAPAADWLTIPTYTLAMPTDSLPGDEVKVFIKGTLRMLAAALDIDGYAAPPDFVALCRLSTDDDAVSISVACPYEHPLRLLEEMRSGPRQKKVRALVGDRSATLEIHHNYGLPENVYVPVVFSRESIGDGMLLMNKNHLAEPTQFIVPSLCTTTSSFLNYVGAMSIDHFLNGRKNFYISAPELLMNRGLDDWFRWLYWLMDTGAMFDPSRMYVRRSDPEQYAYLFGEVDDRNRANLASPRS